MIDYLERYEADQEEETNRMGDVSFISFFLPTSLLSLFLPFIT